MEARAAYSLIEKSKAYGEAMRKETDEYYCWYEGGYWDTVKGAPVAMTTASGVAGAAMDGDDDLNYQTNYTYAFVDTMTANVCPPNPEITLTTSLDEMRDSAKARESLINATLKRNAMHDICWDAATHAAMSGRCPVKVVWSVTRKMPVVSIVDPRAFFYDATVPFRFTRYACEATVITMEEFKRRRNREAALRYKKSAADKVTPTGFPDWLRASRPGSDKTEDDAARDELQWVVIYEFYDFDGGHFWHFAEGVEEPLFKLDELPYKYVKNPYSLLVFNKNLKSNVGIADIKLIADTLRRLNELDTLELRHAHKAIPKTVVNVSLIDNFDEFAEAVSNSDDLDIVQVKTNGQGGPVPISDVIGSIPAPTLPPAVDIMRERSMSTIDFVTGNPQYQRGKTGTSDVATELALIDTASRTRNGKRVRIMGDLVTSVARKIGGLWQQFMEDETIPLRQDDDNGDAVLLTRTELGFDDDGLDTENVWDETWYFDFQVVAFSPAENNKILLLNKLQTMLPSLLQLPNVDKAKLIQRLLELLGLEEAFVAEASAGPPQIPGQPSPPPPGGAPTGGSADTVSSGQMPDGVPTSDELNGNDPRALAQQPYTA